MLADLYIRNFAIIDELRVQLGSGLNVLTGETGAGKSIILDAMTLVLGDRADASMVRDGCDNAYVEATFFLGPELMDSISHFLEGEGLGGDQPDIVLLARELRLNGRNICRINGRAANLALLREVGDQLVDIHGQGEHLSLLQSRSHLPLLDAYAGLVKERTQFSQNVAQLRLIQTELNDLRQDERSLAQRVELLKYQVEEIDAANLRDGEEEELRAERVRLANVEQLIERTGAALLLLNGQDGEVPAASDLLGQVERELLQLSKLDPSQEPLLEKAQGLAFQLNELSIELSDYQVKLEFNPDRLNYVEERIELINTLKRKYGDNIAAILAWRNNALTELEGISHSEERIAVLIVQEDKCLHQIGELGQALSEKRRRAGRRLSSSIESELADLNMDRAQFSVDFSRREDASGAYVGNERLAFDESGIDQVQFLVSANPGEALKPLARVASGGETSRLMLALKTVLARVDSTPTLIFDEIDQGIGGRVGDVVGRKLWGLTASGQHQVIVVTHLPQLAGYADGHFHVSKQLLEGRTTTSVETLDQEQRVVELAAMLGTKGKHARGGARSILQHVAKTKSRAQPPGPSVEVSVTGLPSK